MLFNSYIFVLTFLPIVLIGYFGLNHFHKYGAAKVFLILASLFFYGYFNWWYLLIIVSSVGFNYLFSQLMLNDKTKNGVRKVIFATALTLNIGSLFFFKYYDFFISNVNALFKTDWPLLHILLPLGISFFTFQQLSYVIDSYKRDKNIKQYNFLDYALFVTYFPQLIAGPIVTHDEMVPQFADISKKKFNYDNFAKGLYAFALGMGKKVIIADSFGLLVDAGFADVSKLGTVNALLVMLAYTFQIYFDFSGYCDMATGIGKMMNIDITMNFNSPYKAININDFWKRWHITLTRFFTRYVYIPLGGNRKGTVRTYVNIMIVFLVSGLWHGAEFSFVIWGGLHGLYQVIEDFCHKHLAKKEIRGKKEKDIVRSVPWNIGHGILTFGMVSFAWSFFRANNTSDALYIASHMHRGLRHIAGSCVMMMNNMLLDGPRLAWLLILIFILMVVDFVGLKHDIYRLYGKLPLILRWLLYTVITVFIIVMSLNGGVHQEFIYFSF